MGGGLGRGDGVRVRVHNICHFPQNQTSKVSCAVRWSVKILKVIHLMKILKLLTCLLHVIRKTETDKKLSYYYKEEVD